MRTNTEYIKQYILTAPKERQDALNTLYTTLRTHLPSNFEEAISYKLPAFVVPLSLYPNGYHCKPNEPLPFISFANQKQGIALYHMGIYSMPALHDWFVSEYPKFSKYKLDMGKSCIRFKKIQDIPYDLIAELCRKVTANQWIEVYESAIRPNK